MNIFYLHQSPYLAAKVQYNKHVVKMILESAQMLCTAHHVYGNAEQKLNTKRYGKTHMTIHKCAKFLNIPPVHIPDGDFCEPPQAMPDQYKVPDCSITAYWNYYEGEKYKVANKDEMLITRDIIYEKETI